MNKIFLVICLVILLCSCGTKEVPENTVVCDKQIVEGFYEVKNMVYIINDSIIIIPTNQWNSGGNILKICDGDTNEFYRDMKVEPEIYEQINIGDKIKL